MLKDFGVTLTHDQFYHIFSHTDVKLKTGVRYDSFFKEVLRGKKGGY
jgi:hypothetical protein